MAVICRFLGCVGVLDLVLTLWRIASTILALRRDERILLKLPKYLSLLVILFGLGWLALLPLNEYSRRTYVSENGASYSLPLNWMRAHTKNMLPALLPGQVHTYFANSEHNVRIFSTLT